VNGVQGSRDAKLIADTLATIDLLDREGFAKSGLRNGLDPGSALRPWGRARPPWPGSWA